MGSKLQCSGLALKIFTSKISSSNQVKSWFSRSQKNGGSPNYLGNKHSEKKSVEWQTIGQNFSLVKYVKSKLQQQKLACRVLGVQCYLQVQSKQVDAGPSDSPISHVDIAFCTFPAFLHLGKENHVQITAFARFAEGNILSRNKILEFSGAKFERGNILTHRQSTSKHILSCSLQVIGCCGNWEGCKTGMTCLLLYPGHVKRNVCRKMEKKCSNKDMSACLRLSLLLQRD